MPVGQWDAAVTAPLPSEPRFHADPRANDDEAAPLGLGMSRPAGTASAATNDPIEDATIERGAAVGVTLYLAGVTVVGLAAYALGQMLSGLWIGVGSAGWWPDDPNSIALVAAPTATIATAALLGWATLGRTVPNADRFGVSVGAAIGPAAVVASWTILASPSSSLMNGYGPSLGFLVLTSSGRAPVGMIEHLALATAIGGVASLLQLTRRRRAARAITCGVLCALAAALPMLVARAFVTRIAQGLSDPWSAAYAVLFYVWPAASSGVISVVSYRLAERRRSTPARHGAPTGMTWMPVAAGPDGVPIALAPGMAPPYAVPTYAQGPTNGLAIASFVLSLVALCGIGSVLAIIFGAVALRQIKASNGWQRGRGLAIAGLVIGIVALCFLALYVVLAIVATSSTNGY